nr:terminase family protein [Maliibacterium massiliense]
MSQSAKLARLRAVEAEMRRRQRMRRIDAYNTGALRHEKQLTFHRCGKRNRWVFGGNRSGKTECGAVEAIWFARGIHPYRRIARATHGWVVSLTHEVQRDVAQRKVMDYLPPEWIAQVVMRQGKKGDPSGGVIDYIEVYSACGGKSRIGFKSCDQGRGKFQGASLDYVWFDEEPPEDIYKECLMRVLDRQGDIWGTMTPLLGLTWVHELVYLNVHDDPEMWHIRMQWDDNPFLPEAEKQRMARALSKRELESRALGHFMAGSGLVYPEFDEDIHVIEPFDVPDAWKDRISIDPGLVNPLACHFYACDGDGNVYVVAEHYQSGWTVERHARAIDAIARQLHWPRDSQRRLRALFDPAVHQRTLAGERSAAELFADHGISAVMPQRRDRWSGIQRVREYLALRPATDHLRWPRGRPRLFVCSNCPQMIQEFKKYRFAEGQEGPRKVDDHAMDDLRYYIMSRPEPARAPKPQPSEIARDKMRLAAALGRPMR